MCLIIAGQAAKIRSALLNTEGMLFSIFKTNPDGIGVMYASQKHGVPCLKVVKKLPKTLDAAEQFIARMPDDTRQCAIHFRWTTHGDTNLDNCHPYTVLEGQVALMHNGVLSTGNDKDRTKSDTWWFIEDYLKASIKLAPTLVFDPGYIALVKDFIGSNNRFVFMGADGRMTIVNKKEGIEHDGLWFSNTYAWSPGVFINGYKSGWQGGTYYPPTRSRYFGESMGGDVDDEYDWYNNQHSWSTGGSQSGANKSGVVHNTPVLPTTATKPAASQPSAASQAGAGGAAYTEADAQAETEWERAVRQSHIEWQRDRRAVKPDIGADDAPEEGQGHETAPALTPGQIKELDPPNRGELIEALANSSVDQFDTWLTHYPKVTLDILFHLYKAEPTQFTNVLTDLTAYERYLHAACLAADKAILSAECRREDGSASAVSEVICYYLNWIAWPEVQRVLPTAANNAHVEDPQGSPTEASNAQLGQGGDDSHVDRVPI